MRRKKCFLAIILCFVFVFCACSPLDGGPNGDFSVSAISGAKVLAKPAKYNISEALAGYSENYYNIFAREILRWLHNIYEDQNYTLPTNQELFKNLPTDKDKNEGRQTFGFWGEDANKYYLYDSLRYTIKSIENGTDENDISTQKITIDYDTSWAWTPKGFETVFEKYEEYAPNNIKIEDKSITLSKVTFAEINDDSFVPNLLKFYSAEDTEQISLPNVEGDPNPVADFYYSPYYNRAKNDKLPDAEKTKEMKNYFQDALEYATYLFVLGYEMDADAAYFTFTYDFMDKAGVEKKDQTQLTDAVEITNIKVGGWGNSPISISNGENCALEHVKDLYVKTGKYIGITDKNQKQIAKFVLDVVIGQKALAADTFGVTVDGVKDALKFDRNYEIVVNNIISYACTQARIGKGDDDKPLSLNNSYLMSTVTDYKDTYFAVSYDQDSDDNPLEYIDAAEYQSIVIYPSEQEITDYYEKHGEYPTLGDVALLFEYDGDVEGKENAKELVINVGIRFYKHGQIKSADGQKTGEFVGEAQHQITLKHGPMPKYSDGYNVDTWPDVQKTFMVNFSDTGTGADEAFGEGVYVSETFKTNIGNGAIDPFAALDKIESEDGKRASMTLRGDTKAKDFYMLNDSSSYGAYGTLNPAMFDGEDGCDYFEIYFDIEKSKSNPNINYNFKVGIYGFGFNGTM